MATRSSSRKGRRSKPRPTASPDAPPRSRSAARRGTTRGKARLAFSRQNYLLLGLGLGLIVAGYVLMMMDNATSDDPVNSPLSLYVAPLLLLGGYVEIVYAILWRPRAEAPAEAAA